MDRYHITRLGQIGRFLDRPKGRRRSALIGVFAADGDMILQSLHTARREYPRHYSCQ
jgi:hypothetical protein